MIPHIFGNKHTSRNNNGYIQKALLDGDVRGVPMHPPTAVPNLFHVIKDIFGNKNPDGSKKFYTTPAPGG